MSYLLIVDDEKSLRELYVDTLSPTGFEIREADSAEKALSLIREEAPVLIVSDVKMGGETGVWLLEQVREFAPALPFVIVTAFPSVRDAVDSLKLGAVDYLEKPIDLDELLVTVCDILNISGSSIASELPEGALDGIIAESPDMQILYADAYHVAKSNATVLITGESGTGKEVLSSFIHRNSERCQAPFLTVNCAAIPANILGSELFGHEKGAFTGAVAKRSGRFREADKGTLFLDEIGDMPLELQSSLLRAIENGKITPVGSDHEETVDIRLIAATNKVLEDEIRDGSFREDLFYRLNVISFEIPALRDRPEDILPLARFFLKRADSPKRLSAAAARVLQQYSWPGNVRELANALQRAAIIARTDMIMPDHLPATLKRGMAADGAASSSIRTLKQQEDESIRAALEKTNGNQTKAAELLGISRRTLINKMKRMR